MAQRNLSERDVEYVLTHGCRKYNGGVEFRFLRKRDIRPQDRSEFARLEGTAVVVSRHINATRHPIGRDEEYASTETESDVITVWRNRKHGLRHIRQKTKENFWRRKIV